MDLPERVDISAGTGDFNGVRSKMDNTAVGTILTLNKLLQSRGINPT